MEQSEDEIIQKSVKNVYIVIEKCYFHMNMILLVFHVDST